MLFTVLLIVPLSFCFGYWLVGKESPAVVKHVLHLTHIAFLLAAAGVFFVWYQVSSLDADYLSTRSGLWNGIGFYLSLLLPMMLGVKIRKRISSIIL